MDHTIIDMNDYIDSSESEFTRTKCKTLDAHSSRVSGTPDKNEEERPGCFDYICPEQTEYKSYDSVANSEKSEQNNKNSDSHYKSSCSLAKDYHGYDRRQSSKESDNGIDVKSISYNSDCHRRQLSRDNIDYLCDNSLTRNPGSSDGDSDLKIESRTHRSQYYTDTNHSTCTLSRSGEDAGRESSSCGRYEIMRGRDGRSETKRSSSYECSDITNNIELEKLDSKIKTHRYDLDSAYRRSSLKANDYDADDRTVTNRGRNSGDHDEDEHFSKKVMSFCGDHAATPHGSLVYGFDSRSSESSSTEQSIDLHRRAMRKRAKEVRRAGLSHKAEEHPEYRGDRPIDELLDFINQGHSLNHGHSQAAKNNHTASVVPGEAGKEKAKRKKKLENDPESSSNSVRSESLNRSATDDVRSVETSAWKNTTKDDSFLYRNSKELSEMKASSNLSVKIESNDNISETEAASASLQECCLSDGGIDMKSSSYNDKEFITVNKKKKVKGVQSNQAVRNMARKRNDFKSKTSFSSNPQDQSISSVKEASVCSTFEGSIVERNFVRDVKPKERNITHAPLERSIAHISVDRSIAHMPIERNIAHVPKNDERVGESRRATIDYTTGASDLGFSYAKAVGESNASVDADGTFSQSAFPDLQTKSTGAKLSGVSHEQNTSSAINVTKEYPISYASIAAAAKTQPPKKWTENGHGERERRHSFDSGTAEIFPGKTRGDKLRDDMSVNNAEEFPPIAGRSVAGSAHTLGALDQHSDKSIINNRTEKDCVVPSVKSSKPASEQTTAQQIVPNEITVATSDVKSSETLKTITGTDEVVVNEANKIKLIEQAESKSETMVATKVDLNKCSDGESMFIPRCSAAECSVINSGVNSIPTESNNCSTFSRTRIPREPVIFLDKGREKFEMVSQNFEISFGFDMDCAGDFKSSDLTYSTNHKCTSDTLSASGSLDRLLTSRISQEINSSGEGLSCSSRVSHNSDVVIQSFVGSPGTCRNISSPVLENPGSVNSKDISSFSQYAPSNSRPIALMSTTSPSQLIRTPVGVVPPLNRSPAQTQTSSQSSAAIPATDNKSSDQSFKKTVSACEILELIKMFKPTEQSAAQLHNSCAMSVGRKNGRFDLFGAQVFLYRGFEDTLSADNQCSGNIVHYRADEEVS